MITLSSFNLVLIAAMVLLVAMRGLVFLLGKSLYGIDLDTRNFGTKDGAGQFNTLLTFAVGQGAALAALAKGEYEWLALGIYLGTWLLTLAWIVWLLRALQAGAAPRRVYDRITIYHGRWVLTFNLLFGGLLLLLALTHQLPYQTRREFYTSNTIDAHTYDGTTLKTMRGTRGDSRQDDMDRWFAWLDTLNTRDTGERLFFIEQSIPFEKQYYSFQADLRFDDKVIDFTDRVAFLVTGWDAREYKPIYRQLPFIPGSQSSGRVSFLIEDPNKGERILLLVFAKLKNQVFTKSPKGDLPERPTTTVCNFKVMVPRGS